MNWIHSTRFDCVFPYIIINICILFLILFCFLLTAAFPHSGFIKLSPWSLHNSNLEEGGFLSVTQGIHNNSFINWICFFITFNMTTNPSTWLSMIFHPSRFVLTGTLKVILSDNEWPSEFMFAQGPIFPTVSWYRYGGGKWPLDRVILMLRLHPFTIIFLLVPSYYSNMNLLLARSNPNCFHFLWTLRKFENPLPNLNLSRVNHLLRNVCLRDRNRSHASDVISYMTEKSELFDRP